MSLSLSLSLSDRSSDRPSDRRIAVQAAPVEEPSTALSLARPSPVARASVALLLAATLGGCAMLEPSAPAAPAKAAAAPEPPPPAAVEPPAPVQTAPVIEAAAERFDVEPGLYKCELKRTVRVRSVSPEGKSIVVAWRGRDHQLSAVLTASGALRYESARAGLLWIAIPGKSILFDSKSGRQLANDCKL